MQIAQQAVRDIIARCKYLNVEISNTLAAFTVQLILRQDENHNPIDQSISKEQHQAIVDQCVDMLVHQQRHPNIETIKMQLSFDLCYSGLQERISIQRNKKQAAILALQNKIISSAPSTGDDFETLTSIYRHIFSMLMVDSDASEPETTSRASTPEIHSIEKEVAATLESVFPRTSLKPFINCSPEEKKAQLVDMMDIVAGIRLYNRNCGDGGVGFAFTVEDVQQTLDTLGASLQAHVSDVSSVCCDYTEIILHYHHVSPSSEDAVHSAVIRRWQEELANRRQYLFYLQNVEEDVMYSKQSMGNLINAFVDDMQSLKVSIDSRSSLPRTQVFPLFKLAAQTWRQLSAEYDELQMKNRSLEALLAFKNSIDLSLHEDSLHVKNYRKKGVSIANDDLFVNMEAFEVDNEPLNSSRMASARLRRDEVFLEDAAVPLRIPVSTSNEFLQLPLEYQGFCPWTIVERGGLLLPGDPSLGAVQYKNSYYVFVNQRAMEDFVRDPVRYIDGILDIALHQPALIHLLRLQDLFTDMTLSSLLGMCSASQSKELTRSMFSPPSAVKKRDAGTGTPVHFIEENWDYQYHWNEWDLRRLALRIANIRQCKTVTTQTALSQYRRDAETQMYMARDSETQTYRESGMNTKKTTTYFSGLRSSSYQKELGRFEELTRPSIVYVTL